MYTLKEAAKLCGVHDKTLRRHIASGKLKAEQIVGKRGMEWTVTLDALKSAGLLSSSRIDIADKAAYDNVQDPVDEAGNQEERSPTGTQMVSLLMTQRNEIDHYKVKLDNLEQTLAMMSKVYDSCIIELKIGHQQQLEMLTEERNRVLAERNAAMLDTAAARDETKVWIDRSISLESRKNRRFRWPWQR